MTQTWLNLIMKNPPKDLFLLLLGCFIISPSIASVDNKLHKMCLKAKDYAGCVEANNSKTYEKKNVEKPGKNIFKNNPIWAKYQIDQGTAVFILAGAECFTLGGYKNFGKREKNEFIEKEFKLKNLPSSYRNKKSIKKVSGVYAKKFKNNCKNLQNISIHEFAYSIHSENMKTDFKNTPKNDLIEPTCEQRLTTNDFQSMVFVYSCTMCHYAYELNMKGKRSALSGEKENTLFHVKNWTKITDAMARNPKFGGGFKPEQFVDKSIEIARKKFCPSLF